jgi:hypothetical protein
VILTFPLGTLIGALSTSVERGAARAAFVACALVAPIGAGVAASATVRREVGPALEDDTRLVANEHVADWFRQRAVPGDAIYALCASAGLYGNVAHDPPFPYLWHDNVINIPGARERLAAMLEVPDAPSFVAVYQAPSSCDPSGEVGRALAERYELIDTIDGIAIHRHRS